MPPETPRAPEQDQHSDAIDDVSKNTVSTPEPEGERVAEAGNAYVGRQMSDDMKANPRVEGDGTEGDGTPPQNPEDQR